MKVEFSREVTYVPAWHGNQDLPKKQQITVAMKPMVTGDLIILMDNLQKASAGMADPETLTAMDEPTGEGIEQLKELIAACGEFIPRYCVIDNLEDQSGPIDSEVLTDYTYYIELAAELLSQLGNISMPTEVEEKNSEPRPDTVGTAIQ